MQRAKIRAMKISKHAMPWLLSCCMVLGAGCGDSSRDEKAGGDATPSADQSASSPTAKSSAEDAEKHADPQEPAEDPPFAKVEGERGLRSKRDGALAGYTLIAPLNSKQVHLLDMDGEVAHTWKVDHVPGGGTYLLENGHLLRTAMVNDNPRFHGGGIAGRIEERDWDGNLVWEYELANDQRTTHHDIERLPNGNVLAIAYEYHSPEEAFAKGRAVQEIDPKDGLWCDVILEIEPTLPSGGKIVWEWRSFDHLIQDLDPAQEGYGKPADHPGRIDINADHRYDVEESDEAREAREERQRQIQALGYTGGKAASEEDADDASGDKKKKSEHEADWLHTNAVAYLPALDLIVISTPHLCEIWFLDHSTTMAEAATEKGGRYGRGGEILFRYGNPRNYGRGGASDRKLFYQHDCTFQSDGSEGGLNVLVFNNGSQRPGKEFSSVEEWRFPFDSNTGFPKLIGSPLPQPELIWSYEDRERFFSPFISGAQRLKNGNTLICEGARGRLLEVTREGEIVWDFYNPLGGDVPPREQQGKAPPHALFRATRIPSDHPGLAGRF